ncbi:MAG: hypothetical protein ACI88C_000314 [Acidimicrobiales bacterium]|jgi:hypothetical protein
MAGGADFDGNTDSYESTATRFDGDADRLAIDGARHWPHRENEPTFTGRLVTLADTVSDS